MFLKCKNIFFNRIPLLFKLQEFLQINICILLLSEIPYEKFRFGCGSLEPIHVFFPQYNKGCLNK